MDKKVFREERLRMIMEILWEQKSVSVNELGEKFDKSTGMIRLDLAELENRGLISRTHGGAILVEDSTEDLILNKNVIQLRAETKKEENSVWGKLFLILFRTAIQ